MNLTFYNSYSQQETNIHYETSFKTVNRKASIGRLVGTLERWHSLAFLLIQRRPNDLAIGYLDVRLGHIALEGKGVLHPVLVVTLKKEPSLAMTITKDKGTLSAYLLEVLSGMSTSALLAGRCCNDGLYGALLNVAEFQCLDQVTVTFISIVDWLEIDTLLTSSRSCCGL